jgi:hypothetical protein
MVTRIIGKEDLNASTVSYNSYKRNAQAYSIINKVSNKKLRTLVGCTGACLDPKLGYYPRHLTLMDLRTPIGLASLEISILTSYDLLVYV